MMVVLNSFALPISTTHGISSDEGLANIMVLLASTGLIPADIGLAGSSTLVVAISFSSVYKEDEEEGRQDLFQCHNRNYNNRIIHDLE